MHAEKLLTGSCETVFKGMQALLLETANSHMFHSTGGNENIRHICRIRFSGTMLFGSKKFEIQAKYVESQHDTRYV